MKKILLLSLILIFSCSKDKARLYQEGRELLGTKVNISLIVSGITNAANIFDDAFEEIYRIEKLMSPRLKTSDIMQINNYAALRPVPVSYETYQLINKADIISKDTNGAFDISFATIGKYWKFKQKPFLLPKKENISRILKYTGSNNILLEKNDGKYQVSFKNKYLKIGLGGIAKGYAIKRAIQILQKNKIVSGIVEAGGDLQVIGTKFGKKWQAGLIHPRKKELILAIKLDNNDSIATSGDYERYAFINNTRYNHILDPKTGYPAKNFSSVSVICNDPVEADAYATAFFIMNKKQVQKFLKGNKKFKIIIIDLEMNLFISKELKNKIRLVDKNFIINWI